MTRKLICVLALGVLAICLLSGGCSFSDNDTLKAWKDLIKISPQKDTNQAADRETGTPIEKLLKSQNNSENNARAGKSNETIQVKLYFIGPDGKKLVVEKRTIPKVEGIARRTVEELLKGPEKTENCGIAPDGTKLMDINIKPDGLCLVSLNSSAQKVGSREQEEYMIYAIANTLGQFPTISSVDFMINGEKVDSIGKYVDLSQPIKPDYSI
ncbi:MAG: GerMN domain-containing protein [Syntrophomonadaceae bacterium]|jgi:germination protein M